MLGPRWEARIVPKPYPAELRVRAVALVRGEGHQRGHVGAGDKPRAAPHSWVRQDQIDQGERLIWLPGVSRVGCGPAADP